MLSKADSESIRDLSRKYNVARVILFGSSCSSPEEARDIDLAVEGISPCHFFAFYGDLMCSLSKPVDLIDLADRNLFTKMAEQEGVVIYG